MPPTIYMACAQPTVYTRLPQNPWQAPCSKTNREREFNQGVLEGVYHQSKHQAHQTVCVRSSRVTLAAPGTIHTSPNSCNGSFFSQTLKSHCPRRAGSNGRSSSDIAVFSSPWGLSTKNRHRCLFGHRPMGALRRQHLPTGR